MRTLRSLAPGLSRAIFRQRGGLSQGQFPCLNKQLAVAPLARPLPAFHNFFWSSSNSTSTTPPEDKKPEEKADADPEATEEGGEGEKDLETLLAEKDQIIAEKEAKVKSLEETVLRTYADMENLRTRSQKQQEDARKFAVQGFVKGLFDVSDNLERAAATVPAEALAEGVDAEKTQQLLKSLHEGVLMTEKQMLHVFKMNGVERYDPLGDEFDPNLHMAMFKMPDAEKENNTVAAVVKCGYTLHDRVVRPAEVGVVQNS